MASEKGSIATEDAILTATLAPPGPPSQPTASDVFAYDPGRAKSLKRTRSTSPTSPTSPSSNAADRPGGPFGSPTKAARYALAISRSSVPLTGAAAREDLERLRREEEHQQRLKRDPNTSPPPLSDNPNQRVLTALAGHATSAMSRPSDAPQQAPTASMDVVAVAVPLLNSGSTNNTATNNNNNHTSHNDTAETSPQSAVSAANMAGALVTASPTPMDVDPSLNDQTTPPPPPPQPAQEHHDDSNSNSNKTAVSGSLSYPGSLLAGGGGGSGMQAPPTPHRNLSFPMHSPGQDSSGHSSGKKHKCPYCETEFTRHHNLKSHLLTHSQEKPFVCSQCDSKFRRLHDLKRHSKLHTGEKNHTCPKCNRKFARGDALARHSKGPGGCAGRRSSMGAFADDMDDSMQDGDDSMTGVVYPNDDNMNDEERRQLSQPPGKSSHASGAPFSGSMYLPQSRTHPPAGSLDRPSGGLYPPPLAQERGGLTPNSNNVSGSAVPAVYASGAGMTESPKPLSPSAAHDGANHNRQRSPSLTQQYQQQHFGRRLSGRQSPPAYGGAAQAGVPSAHGRNSSGSHAAASDSANNVFSVDPAVWTYIQSLEDHIKQLADTVSGIQKSDSAKQAQISLLTTDVTALKRQLQSQEGEVGDLQRQVQAQQADAATKQAQIDELSGLVTELRSQLSSRAGDAAEAAE
ncbi:chorion transcription factor Cf2 [Plectosphaerella cucumerina]|uniref:Chorion transcription factor Cf2 n=1 Tax=Plectosphaerella cucumerina TaxID=40658 RepID=A0A8K0TSZ5_9PEZI|nr:chorion transcription factor Cf2 [Plectosphaerella cucumerina]